MMASAGLRGLLGGAPRKQAGLSRHPTRVLRQQTRVGAAARLNEAFRALPSGGDLGEAAQGRLPCRTSRVTFPSPNQLPS